MIYIRTDMNSVIATGHVMRCLAVADAARGMGEETMFLLADGEATELLEKRGYRYRILDTSWEDMESELPVLRKIIEEQEIHTLLIDSYQVTEKYLAELGKLVRTVYIDDVNAFVYPVSALICYANYYAKFHYEENYSAEQLFLGTEYVPLRAVYADCSPKRIADTAENLLVMSGGTDQYDILSGILRVVQGRNYRRIEVVCGAYYKNYDALCKTYAGCENVVIRRNVSDIEASMQRADMAITAGGSTMYELCACGTPAISYSFADNQLGNVEQFHSDQVIDYAGDVRYVDVPDKLLELLDRYDRDAELRRQRSEKMRHIVDGKGAARIARILIGEGRRQQWEKLSSEGK